MTSPSPRSPRPGGTARHHPRRRLRRLAVAVTAQVRAAATLVDGVLADLLGQTGADDDFALVVRLLPAPLRLDLPAEPAQLYWLRRAVYRWATEAGRPWKRGGPTDGPGAGPARTVACTCRG
jgi:hypothetical protein